MKKFLKKLNQLTVEKFSYTSAQSKNDKNDNKQRKHKVIWYNPPYSANIKTILVRPSVT